jgi:hypothetical protein
MPYTELYDRLRERTGGRILRGDGNINDEKNSFKGAIFDLSYGSNVKAGDPLWVELSLKL